MPIWPGVGKKSLIADASQLFVANNPFTGGATAGLPLFRLDAAEPTPLAHGKFCLAQEFGNLAGRIPILHRARLPNSWARQNLPCASGVGSGVWQPRWSNTNPSPCVVRPATGAFPRFFA